MGGVGGTGGGDVGSCGAGFGLPVLPGTSEPGVSSSGRTQNEKESVRATKKVLKSCLPPLSNI